MHPQIPKMLLKGGTTSVENYWVRCWPKSQSMTVLLSWRQQEPGSMQFRADRFKTQNIQ